MARRSRAPSSKYSNAVIHERKKPSTPKNAHGHSSSEKTVPSHFADSFAILFTSQQFFHVPFFNIFHRNTTNLSPFSFPRENRCRLPISPRPTRTARTSRSSFGHRRRDRFFGIGARPRIGVYRSDRANRFGSTRRPGAPCLTPLRQGRSLPRAQHHRHQPSGFNQTSVSIFTAALKRMGGNLRSRQSFGQLPPSGILHRHVAPRPRRCGLFVLS